MSNLTKLAATSLVHAWPAVVLTSAGSSCTEHCSLMFVFQCCFAGAAEGAGGAGRAAAALRFCATAPLFALNRKKVKINEKDLKQVFFPSIFRYILYIFFNFKRQAFCGAPVLFTVIVPWGRLAPWSNAMPRPPLRFVRQRVLYFQLRQSVSSVLSDEIKKITSFFKPNEGEWLFWVDKSFIFCLSPFELMKYSMARITLLEQWTLIGVVFSILKL